MQKNRGPEIKNLVRHGRGRVEWEQLADHWEQELAKMK